MISPENYRLTAHQLGVKTPFVFLCINSESINCKKSVLKIQEYIHEGANLKFYIPEFFNFKLLIDEYSPI
jgi:hypothetical protein